MFASEVGDMEIRRSGSRPSQKGPAEHGTGTVRIDPLLQPGQPVQRCGVPVEPIRRGDVVSIVPSEKHWHGAAPTTAMTHIAIQESRNGKNVDGPEKVTEEPYCAGPGAGPRPSTAYRNEENERRV
jgi:hypothetical protein